MNQDFLREAIRLSLEKMEAGEGGPFGAIIVRNGEIVGRGWNRVTSTNDPTAHARSSLSEMRVVGWGRSRLQAVRFTAVANRVRCVLRRSTGHAWSESTTPPPAKMQPLRALTTPRSISNLPSLLAAARSKWCKTFAKRHVRRLPPGCESRIEWCIDHLALTPVDFGSFGWSSATRLVVACLTDNCLVGSYARQPVPLSPDTRCTCPSAHIHAQP